MYFILFKTFTNIYKFTNIYSERGPMTLLDGQKGPWYRKVKTSDLKGWLNHKIETHITE